MKVIQWIKNKMSKPFRKIKPDIQRWFIGKELDEIHRLSRKLQTEGEYCCNRSKECQESLKVIEDFFSEKGAQIAIDRHMKSPSWAVFCIQGKKYDFVHMSQIPDNYLKDIIQIVKRFEYKPIYDGPLNEKTFLIDELNKNNNYNAS